MIRWELVGVTSVRQRQERTKRLVAEGGWIRTEAVNEGARSGGSRLCINQAKLDLSLCNLQPIKASI